jgi:hypothetical protein
MRKHPKASSLIPVVVVAAVLFCVASVCFAAENQGWLEKIKSNFAKKDTSTAQKSSPPAAVKKENAPVKDGEKTFPPKKKRKDMTKGELIEDIVDILDDEDEIIGLIPGLKKETDPLGGVSYTYNGTKLENLDKDILGGISGRIHQELVKMRTERLQRQLENIKRVERLSHIQQAPRVPGALPPAPPQAPRSVQAPPRPPSVPSAPPVPPSTSRK